MKNFPTYLAAAAVIVAITAPAMAGGNLFSRAEVAWGRVAQACLERNPRTSGCRVVEQHGRLTMWCPAGVDVNFTSRMKCDSKAESASGPPKWTFN